MSGESPGRGHPGWGSSPIKAQASQPILGNNPQTPKSMDEHPKVSPEGRNVQNVASPGAERSKDGKKVVEVKKETSASKVMAAGVQSSPPAVRQRRTSLEKQTIQENLQQPVLIRSDRTRYGSGSSAKVTTPEETKGTTAGRLQGATSAVTGKIQGPSPQHGECDPAAVTTATPSQIPKKQSPVSTPQTPPVSTPPAQPVSTPPAQPVSTPPAQPVSTPPARPPNTQRAPELCLAERIPALVRRLETLKKAKLLLQKQMDCVYKLKAANPKNQAVHDKKLSALAVQLADTEQDMEKVLEQMGPVGETFRNHQHFEGYKEGSAPKSSTAEPKTPTSPDNSQQSCARPDGTQQSCARPVLRPASFPFEEGDLYRQVGASVQQQQRPAETPGKVQQVPAVSMVKQNCGLPPKGNSVVTVQSPQAQGGSREQQDCGLPPKGNSVVTVQSPQAQGGSREQQDCGLLPEGNAVVAVQSPQAQGGSREQQDCGLLPEGSAVVAVQSPQAQGGSREQQDCGLLPEGSSAAESSQDMSLQGLLGSVVQDHTASDCTDISICDTSDNVPAVCNVSDNVSMEGNASQSVWDLGSSQGSGPPPLVQPSESCDPESIEVDGDEGAVQSDAQHFPPLVTQVVSDPPSADGQQPPQRPQVQQEGRTGGASSGNAWSRGSPFMSNVNYTGQAFRRRNVVRFKHRGAKEELPDRRFVVRELLCRQMGFQPSAIMAVINLPDRQGYDVSFKLMSDLDRFWAYVTRVRDTDDWNKFTYIPISRPDTANVTIIFWNESVPHQDIVVWLRRHCDLMSDLTKTRDEDGIWTGGWRVLVKLRQINNITQHLPNSFFIGREKGVCFYAGQPRKCFKCGKTGHIASVCTLVKCNLCGEIGHVSATCQSIRCNLCGKTGHSHRDCPDAWHNICKDFPDEDLMEGAEDLEEETLLSGSAVTQPTPQDNMGDNMGDIVPDQSQPGATEGSREVTEQVVATSSSAPVFINPQKRRKKDKTSRRSEEEWTTVQKPFKKKVDPGSGVMTVSNRYSVLSESDAEEEMERELKRVVEELDEEQEGDPPTKRRPPRDKHPSESDMETGGQQEGSDSDL